MATTKKQKQMKKIMVPLQISLEKGNFSSTINSLEKELEKIKKGVSSFDLLSESDVRGLISKTKAIEEAFGGVKDVNANLSKGIINDWTNVSKAVIRVSDSIETKGMIPLQNATKKVKTSFADLRMEVDRTETFFTKFGRTMVNSLRYQVVNSALDTVAASFQGTIQYFERIDENLTNISIVSGKTNEELQGFVKTAQSYAKALGSLTNEYLEAAEFFYQQGLSSNEVLQRTNATIQAANVSGQSVTETANQMTAVLNGFDIAASQTTSVLDKMAALGAGTATDFEEIATAVQKVASAASEAGVGLDETLAMISTISSVTREAPESVGTSLNSIISRMNNLTVAEKDNIDSYTSQVQKAYESVNAGLTIFDGEGLIKDRALILSELADKWAELDKNQQATITTALAGTRQANKLYALLGNWNEYESYLSMSKNSEGALAEQNDIYLQSYEAIRNNTKLIQEEIWGNIFDTDLMRDFHENFLQPVLRTIEAITGNIGGWKGLITPMLGLLREPLTSILTPHLTNKTFRKTLSSQEKESLIGATETGQQRVKILNTERRDADGNKIFNALLKEEIELIDHKARQKYFTPEQDKAYVEQNMRLEETVSLLERADELTRRIESNGAGGAISQIDTYRRIFGDTSERSSRINQYKNDASEASKIKNRKFLEEAARAALGEEGVNPSKLKSEMNKIVKSVNTDAKASRANLTPLLQKIGMSGGGALPSYLRTDDIEYTERPQEYNDQFNFINQLNRSGQLGNAFNTKMKTQSGLEFNIGDLFATNDKGMSTPEATKIARSLMSEADSVLVWNEVLKTLKTSIPEDYDLLSEAVGKITDGEQKMIKDTESVSSSNQKFKAAATTGERVELASKMFVGLSGALSVFNIVSDKTLSQQEKIAQSSSQLMSVTGSLLSATHPVIGIMFQLGATVIPALVKSLGIGVSEYEKLAKATSKAVDAQKALTKSIREQKTLLSSAEAAYSSLAKAYQEGTLDVTNLTEEQSSMYQQAVEYITQYNPELIKGYNAEGEAILDLSAAYKDLENNKQGYLRTSLNSKESELYSQFTDGAAKNGRNIYKTKGSAEAEARRLEKQIFQLRERASSGSGDYSEELSKLEQQLANVNIIISETGLNWNELVTKPITVSNVAFSGLSAGIQNSVNELASFNSFLNSPLTENNFIEQTRSLVYALGEASLETRKNLSDMSEEVRSGLFELTMNTDMNSSVIGSLFSGINQESFLRGSFIEDLIPTLETANASMIGGLSPEESQKLNDLQKRLNEVQSSRSQLESNSKTADYRASGFIESQFSQMDTEIDSLEGQISAIQQSYVNLQTVEDDLINGWKDTLVEVATSSADGFNLVAKEFNEMKEELAKGISLGGFGEEEISSYEKRMGAMYTALNANNEDFFVKWKELNSGTINQVSKDLGVSADNYRTYAEYQLALEQALAKKKVLLSALATGDQAKIEEAYNEFRKDVALQRLENEGLVNKQVVISYANAAKVQELTDHEVTLSKLEALRDRLEGELKSATTGTELSEEVAKKYIADLNEVGEVGARIINSFGGEVAFSAQTGSFDAIGKDLLSQIDAQIKSVETKRDAILSDKSGSVIAGKSIDDLMAEGGKDIQEFMNSLKAITFKDFTDTSQFGDVKLTEMPKINNTGGIGSGDSGSSKESEDLEFDIDPLKPYQDKIDSITDSLKKMEQTRAKLYGKNYLDSLKKENELNKELLKAEEAKLKKAIELSSAKKSELAAGGVKFNADNTISNYNEILTGLENATNKLTGEQKEASSEAAKEFKELMDEYEKYGIDTVRTSEEAISSIKIALAENARESIEYPIKLILDESELDKKVFDFLNGISKLENGEIKISFEGGANLDKLSNAMSTINKMFAIGDGSSFLDSVINNPDLAGNQTQQREILEGQMSNMMSLGQELTTLVETMDQSFNSGLGAAMTSLAEEIGKFNDITVQHQRILEISKALNTTTMDGINSTYEAVESIYRQNLGAQQTLAGQMKAARDQFEKGSSSWLTANAKYLEAQKNVLETEKQIAELLSSKYDDTAASGRKSIENALFGGTTSKQALKDLTALTKEKEKYLDTQDEIYELSKFERAIQKDINSLQGNPKAQAALRKFQDRELDYLNNKEKITKNDLELSQKQYDVFKARIELEKAQEGGNMELMLQRNSDGSYGYMYVKSMEEVDAAAQKYEDSINSLYDFAVENIAKLQKESLTIRDEALSEYDSIVADLRAGIIDVATAEEKLGKVFEKVNEDLAENARLQKEMEQQAVSANILQILGVGGANANLSGPLSTSLTSVFDVLGNSGGTALTDVIKKLGYSTSSFIGTTGEQIAQLFEELGGDDGAMTTLMNAFAETNDATSATILALLKETSDLALATEQILDTSLVGSGQDYEDYLAKISADAITPEDLFTQTMTEGLDSVKEIWTSLADVIKLDLSALESEFNMENENGVLSKVTKNLTTAYTDYNTALTESLDRLRAEQTELKTATDAMNTALSDQVLKLGEEIVKLAETEKGYQAVREGIISTITETGKYVSTLQDGLTKVSNTAVSSMSKVDSQIAATTTNLNKAGTAAKSAGDKAAESIDKVSKKLQDLGKDIDGSGLKIPVQKPSGSGGVATVGGKYVHTIEAFHTGGKVNVNREGYALLEKNEAVITEKQAQIIASVRDIANSMISSQGSTPVVGTTIGNTVVNMSFPNVSNSNEIIEAFEGLSVMAQQKVKKN